MYYKAPLNLSKVSARVRSMTNGCLGDKSPGGIAAGRASPASAARRPIDAALFSFLSPRFCLLVPRRPHLWVSSSVMYSFEVFTKNDN